MTFVFWAKWLGKVLAVGKAGEHITTTVTAAERTALACLTVLLACVTLGLPWLSDFFVMPYLHTTGGLFGLASWLTASTVLSYDNLVIMSIIFAVLLALLAVQVIRKRPVSNDTVYLAGAGANSEDRSFLDSFGEVRQAEQRNWYLEPLFGERALGRQATVLMGAVMGLFLVLGIIAELMPL